MIMGIILMSHTRTMSSPSRFYFSQTCTIKSFDITCKRQSFRLTTEKNVSLNAKYALVHTQHSIVDIVFEWKTQRNAATHMTGTKGTCSEYGIPTEGLTI